ncbi:caspase-2 isoform X2 [Oryzias latipes]|uniref:Caspase-2 n=1 Tax=Oryzias latipes TaxID=8090 RepID=H2M9D1_ORYLA|nr:caspase-2 isoform X2 [Oryzias latipes]
MQKRDAEALRNCSVCLLKDLVVDELLIQALVKDGILTQNMAESIMVQKTSHHRSFKLLLLLPKRGPRAFKSFCSALKETEQEHLCDLLTQEEEGREVCLDSVQSETETTGRPGWLKRANKRETPLINSEEQSEVSSSMSYPIHDSDSCCCCCCCSGPSARDENKERQRAKISGSSLPYPTQEEFAPKRAKTLESMESSLDADSPINTPVLACSADFYLSHCQQSYRMNSSPRGSVLVISNINFDPRAAPELDPRKGGEVDDEVLRKLFTELDYSVNFHRDLTAQDMKMVIENFCRRPDHQKVDSCVVCLLSHGVDGAIYGTDGQQLALDWVFEAFDNAHCPLLQNKPKMFFIQACRGDEMDCGVEQIDGPARTFSPTCEQRDAGREEQGDADGRQRASTGRQRIKLPQRSDMICGFASLKGTAAMRNTKKGSWFIQELNTALRLNARDTHLADILVQVNKRIKEREGYAPGTAHHRCKEMSEFTSSLCKDLYLFPKYQPQC